jgi:putative sterol carrier protein
VKRLRAVPPDDISPEAFFTRWVPEAVAADPARRARLGDALHTLEFELEGPGGGVFTLELGGGGVAGRAGAAEHADLRVRVDVDTWRRLNRGEISAPEAFLRRHLHLRGNLLLAVKLHLILG